MYKNKRHKSYVHKKKKHKSTRLKKHAENTRINLNLFYRYSYINYS